MKESVRQYLSKVKSLEWKLRECKERIPSTYEGAKLLLEYGLSLASNESGSGMGPTVSVANKSSDSGVSQEELKLYCHIFKQYLQRLDTYVILGSNKEPAENKNETYLPSLYLSFRSTPLVYSCISLALEGHWDDVAYIFNRHPGLLSRLRQLTHL